MIDFNVSYDLFRWWINKDGKHFRSYEKGQSEIYVTLHTRYSSKSIYILYIKGITKGRSVAITVSNSKVTCIYHSYVYHSYYRTIFTALCIQLEHMTSFYNLDHICVRKLINRGYSIFEILA